MNSNFFDLSKRSKRDLLTELLLGESTEGIISKKELNALNKLIAAPSSNKAIAKLNTQPAGTKKVTAAGKKSLKRKRKTTFYLSQELSDHLIKAQMTIRSLVPADRRLLISKSFIVSQSLAKILQEFETEGKNSRLFRAIMQKR